VPGRERQVAVPTPLRLADRQPCAAQHTPDPPGYIEWFAWAEWMATTHRQVRCLGCGLWAIWVPKESPTQGR
jgi:hypothetical protein